MAGAGDFLSGMAGGMQTGMSINRMRDEQQQRNQEREIDEQRRQQEEEAAKRQEELRQQNQQQPSGQQGMGIDPSMAQSFMSNGSSSGAAAGGSGSLFGGAGSSGASGTGAMGLPTSYTGYLGGSSAAGGSAAGGSAGGSSMGGAAAAAGPWAALAAVIAVNEKSARNGGHRRDGWQYGKDLLGSKVIEQDTNERWAPKIFGNNDKAGLGADMKAGAEFTTLDFKNGGKQLGKGTIGKVIKKIF